MANVIVTKTVNEVTWKVDQTAYGRAMKQIKSLKTEWEKAGTALTKRGDPAAVYKRSATQARLVSRRLQQTERAETTKTTAHNIAMAKRESRAREAIAKRENARRVQAVRGITSKDPELNRMKKFYQEQSKASAKAGPVFGTDPAISARRMAAYEAEVAAKRARAAQTAASGGVVGDTTGGYRPGSQAGMQRGTDEMNRRRRAEKSPQQIKAEEKARRDRAKEDARQEKAYRSYMAGKESTLQNASVRLRAKYGDNFATKLNGFGSLKERFMESNSMKSSNFRAELAAMESQLRSANAGALTFSDGLKNLRSTLISVTAAYSAFNAGAKVLATGQFFQGMEATMLMVSDNSVEAGERMKFVQDQAYRLGLDLKIASQGYTQMSIAADGVLSKSQNNDLFKSFSEYSTALQVDPVKYQRGITAIQQMMGKGQIMAEELKQQLAEGIPGSLQVFVKATQDAFGDTSIDVEKLMDMMQKGELKAAKVLPFVAKHYAEAARKGGAIDKALAGNRVAMQRLQQTWMQFENKVFESGFGDAMTRAFNGLAQMMGNGGPLANAIGEISGGFVDGFMLMIDVVHDAFIIIDALFQKYIPGFKRDADEVGEAWKWLGWAAGAGTFAVALAKVFIILSKIAGLSTSLKFLTTIFGDSGADAKDGGNNKGGTPKGGASRFTKILKHGGGLLSLFAFGSELNDRYNPFSDFNAQRGEVFDGINKQITSSGGGGGGGFLDFLKDATGFSNLAAPTFSTPGVGPRGVTGPGGMPLVIPTEPVSGEIRIILDEGEMKNLFKQEIKASEMQQINMILGVPQ